MDWIVKILNEMGMNGMGNGYGPEPAINTKGIVDGLFWFPESLILSRNRYNSISPLVLHSGILRKKQRVKPRLFEKNPNLRVLV